MWLALAFLSAFFLGCYDVNKKLSLTGNAVIPVLFLNTLISSLIFVPFILLSYFTPMLDGTMVYVPNIPFYPYPVLNYFYRVPRYKKIIPIKTNSRSRALLFRFFSWKNRAPAAKVTNTLLLRIMETIEIIESGKLNA